MNLLSAKCSSINGQALLTSPQAAGSVEVKRLPVSHLHAEVSRRAEMSWILCCSKPPRSNAHRFVRYGICAHELGKGPLSAFSVRLSI